MQPWRGLPVCRVVPLIGRYTRIRFHAYRGACCSPTDSISHRYFFTLCCPKSFFFLSIHTNRQLCIVIVIMLYNSWWLRMDGEVKFTAINLIAITNSFQIGSVPKEDKVTTLPSFSFRHSIRLEKSHRMRNFVSNTCYIANGAFFLSVCKLHTPKITPTFSSLLLSYSWPSFSTPTPPQSCQSEW